ncbi:MAG TPA: creatininase family protein [Opitutaceae bacterium]
MTTPAPSAPATPPLCVADEATFWPWHASPRIAAWPNPAGTVVVLPLAGMADWGLGHPLDAEETVLMHVLKEACHLAAPDRKPLVVPPLRFAFGPDPSCAFAVDAPTAHALIAEVAASVAAAGFRKIVIVNASPWGEELCSAAARDLRVSRGLQMFQIHLSAIDLDFHPVRSKSRRSLQTLLTFLNARAPDEADPAPAPKAGAWGDESVTPLPGPAAGGAESQAQGAAFLARGAGRLAKLLSDIHDRAPLRAHVNPA